MRRWSIDRIQEAHAEAGGFFFSGGWMRFFRSRLESAAIQGPGGIFFVTSEQMVYSSGEKAPRSFTVREWDPLRPWDIGTESEHPTLSSAMEHAKAAAMIEIQEDNR